MEWRKVKSGAGFIKCSSMNGVHQNFLSFVGEALSLPQPRIPTSTQLNVPAVPRCEAPLPPMEGEVVERQRNRRGLYVNRAVQETPQSARSGCQLSQRGSQGRVPLN